MEEMKSPITLSKNVVFVRKYSMKWLIGRYKKSFNIDISYLVESSGEKYLSLYRCLDTGYEFYYPFISGDSDFYEKMGKLEHYYDEWKMENELVVPFIQTGNKVLDIGCGCGGFIDRINKTLNVDAVGIELNASAVQYANSKGRNVRQELLSEHLKAYTEYYDVVCSFQVFEHITNVNEMFSDSVKCLKKGGTLIISVPNNDTSIGFYKYGCGNMSPHHVGRWNEQVLRSIAPYFGIKLKCIMIEPVLNNRIDFAQPMMSLFFHNYYVGKILYKLKIHLIMKSFFDKISPWLKGHTIIAIYEKC